MSSVLQEWVMKLPWKQQSVLLSGLRGPDGARCPNIKNVTRWLRNITQNNADPSHSYMMVGQLPNCEMLEKELEYVSVHYVHHLAQAMKVVAIGVDVYVYEKYARELYEFISNELLHMKVETDDEFNERLRDMVEHE